MHSKPEGEAMCLIQAIITNALDGYTAIYVWQIILFL